MPGMNSGLSNTNPTIVAAFRAALLHQGLLILAILVVLALAWVSVREFVPSVRGLARRSPTAGPEPAGRKLLRVGFGIVWIFDGVLQAQPAMPAGLPSGVIEPSAATSPAWVQHAVNWAGTGWSYHPIQAGAAAVWIQIGIGVWLLLAPAGQISRLAGLASAGWGLIVWVFGESFGGIFAPGQSVLFGTPGAALIYCAAGLLVALPDPHWRTPRLGRQILAGLGLFLAAMAILQAWPGRGFWQGAVHGKPAPLAAMVASMAGTSQPHFLSGWLRAFESFDAGHGFSVNLVVVIALAAIGAGLLSGRTEFIRPALGLGAVVGLATWVLVQDLGFLGGLGTDPNSIIPLGLVAAAGYVALRRPLPEPAVEAKLADAGQAEAGPAEAVPAGAVPTEAEPTEAEPAEEQPVGADPGSAGRRLRLDPATLARVFGGASIRAVLSVWAAAIVLVGAGPMMLAQASPNADPIIAQAIDGSAAPMNFAAPAFSLTSQAGRPVSLASLRGKVVLLTFLDPVCTSDCPVIAQEFRVADQMLGGSASRVELVAIVANPVYRSLAYTKAFDSQELLSQLPNWLFLTGTIQQLQRTWSNYGIAADILPAGGMIAHSDVAYVIDAAGHTRTELDFDPGPGTSSSVSSFAVELSDAARQYLRSR
jgi:cytochrome oxidase Cu insertion factor (SCO1/SenC/PrrC family)